MENVGGTYKLINKVDHLEDHPILLVMKEWDQVLVQSIVQ